MFGTCAPASAAPDSDASVASVETAGRVTQARPAREVRPAAAPRPSARAVDGQRRAAQTARVSVSLPPLPVREGSSFTVSDDAISARAVDYVEAGGDPGDTPRFFFGDLAVSSLETLADSDVTAEKVRQELGNLTASGYFGGIWLRDNLRDVPPPTQSAPTAAADLTVSAIGIRLFDALAAGLTGAAASPSGWVVRSVAHVSVPMLLALYGYNRGYLEVLLENPPPGVKPAPGSLVCDGFLSCSTNIVDLEIATRYDAALDELDTPRSPAWWEMTAWTSLLESATGAGRFVWELIAAQGSFSPASYAALVELSSTYLMVSKAAVLSSMQAYAGGDTALGRSSLRLQAGLWMWSGAYFGGLASGAPAGTLPRIMVAESVSAG
jgi:hypothetical protein